MKHLHNPSGQKDVRQRLRARASLPERILWKALRGKQLAGLKFRRQHGIGPYVVDFYCAALQLVVEVDGPCHSKESAQVRDEARQQWLEAHGLTVLRVKTEEVMEQMDRVLSMLKGAADMTKGAGL